MLPEVPAVHGTGPKTSCPKSGGSKGGFLCVCVGGRRTLPEVPAVHGTWPKTSCPNSGGPKGGFVCVCVGGVARYQKYQQCMGQGSEHPVPAVVGPGVGATHHTLGVLSITADVLSQQRIQRARGPAPLAPKISSKSCSFRAVLRENPSTIWAPPLGSRLRWASPLTKILDPRL